MEIPSITDAPVSRQCDCGKQVGNSNRIVKWTTAGGVFAAFGVCAACCLLPFALLSVGVAGAWVSTLDALIPYKWIFITVSAALFGYGFYVVYLKPKRRCAAGAACKACEAGRSIRLWLWIGTILAVSGIAFEYLVVPLLDGP